MQVLAWFARHGSDRDTEKNIFRGQRNPPLDKQGFVDAHKLKDFFEDKDWHEIFCSDLKRATQTADVIAEGKSGEKPIIVKKLRPRHVGYLTGKDKDKHGKEMQFFLDHPDEAPEGGESTNEFESERAFPLLANAMQIGLENGKPCIVVSHSSFIHTLAHFLYGDEHPNISVEPGGVVEVFYDKGEFGARPIFKPGKDDSSFATNTLS